MTRAVIPAQGPRRRARVAVQLSVVDHEDVLLSCPESSALADEGRPKDAAVQEDGRRDGAVDVHLVVEPSAGFDLEEHRRKDDRDRRGREHDLAKEIQRLQVGRSRQSDPCSRRRTAGNRGPPCRCRAAGRDCARRRPCAETRRRHAAQSAQRAARCRRANRRAGARSGSIRSIRCRRCRAWSSSCRTRAARRRTAVRGTQTAPSLRRSTRR